MNYNLCQMHVLISNGIYNMSKTANPEDLWIIPLSMSFVTDNLMLLYKTCNFFGGPPKNVECITKRQCILKISHRIQRITICS